MKRYTGQKALYEAISRSRGKAKQGSILEKLRPAAPPRQGGPVAQEPQPPVEPPDPESMALEPSELQAIEMPLQPIVEPETESEREPMAEMPPEPVEDASPESPEHIEPAVMPRPVERLASPIPPGRMQRWLRPRPVQFNEGRIEVSVPYYVGLIAVLTISVVVLAAYRLGQARSNGQVNDAGGPVQAAVDRSGVSASPPTRPASAEPVMTKTDRPPANPPAGTAGQPSVTAPATQGDHWIVLAQYRRYEDFEPVIKHFAGHGIQLGYVSLDRLREFFAANKLNSRQLSGDGYLLVTMDYFENPNAAGTDGYKMKQEIIRIGALYRGKAPRVWSRLRRSISVMLTR